MQPLAKKHVFYIVFYNFVPSLFTYSLKNKILILNVLFLIKQRFQLFLKY